MKNLSFFIIFLSFLFIIPISAQDDDEVISVDSSLVILNASINDAKGNPVTNLKQNQFKILEDGVEQEINLFESTESPFAAVILIDTSGSMESRISLARSAAITFLDGLDAEDVAAIYNFDSKVTLVQDFSNSRDISDRVYDLKAYGWTVLNDAVFKAADELSKRPEKRRAVIVISDGADTKSGKSADKALKAALAADVMIYTVDMSAIDTGGKERIQNQSVLRNFAEKTGGFFIATPGGQAMRDAFKQIASELGTQYTIGYQPTNLKKDGKWRALELRVQRPNLTIRTRKGYNAPKK